MILHSASRFFILILCLLVAGFLVPLSVQAADSVARAPVAVVAKSKSPARVKPVGERGKKLQQAYGKGKSSGTYAKWKRRLPFWPRKVVIFLELGLLIAIGVLAGQALEILGLLNRLAVIAWPLLRLGGLPKQVGMAFLIAFQSGRVANTMLVSYRDESAIDDRELYTGALVISCLSLFAHLPTFVIPFATSLGWEAALAFFGVRLVSIGLEILLILTVSRWLVKPWFDAQFGVQERSKAFCGESPVDGVKAKGPFLATLWRRSRKTVGRLLVYMVPTFILISLLEYCEAFQWVAQELPGVFAWSFLPSEAPAIIGAQAVNLYNGAMAGANFVDMGAISSHQAVIIILFGSIITAPFRTLKHALPTYLAVFGARPGMVLAVGAQILRVAFVLFSTIALMLLW